MNVEMFRDMAEAAFATEEARAATGPLVSVILSIPAALVGQLLKRLGLAEMIPALMGGVGWVVGFAVSWYARQHLIDIPQDFACMAAAGGGLMSGVVHDLQRKVVRKNQ